MHFKRQNGTKYALLIILHLSVCPDNQLRAESEVADNASFLDMLRLLHNVTNEEQHKKLNCT